MAERRLAAILVLDVVGYSALVGADETATLARLRALRADSVDPLIATHGGRIFKTTGDGLLAEFPSAVGALGCAIAIQQRQRDAADALVLRIGLHQGEVVVEGDDLLGDGVNIAARIEPLAEPGGIAMSARVREDATGKIDFEAEDLGVPTLKNIARPVRVFRLRIAPPTARPPPPPGTRPALVVLPFRGGGPADEPFTDGLTDELTNALAAWRSFPVIARNSAFAYRGGDIDVRVIGRDLGVRYVLTGIVRRAGAKLRLTVELADVETADILLTEHFAYDAADLVGLQDEIVRAVAGILAPEVQKLERERGLRRASAEAGAYELFTRGMWHRYRNTRDEVARAEALFRAALEIDPRYTRAITALSLCRNYAAINRWDADFAAAHAESLALAQQAVADDPRDPHAHFAHGVALMNHQRLAAASAALGEAVRLNPSHAFARANLGQVQNYLNQPALGLPEIEAALRLNPLDPLRYMWLPYAAASHYLAGRYRACLEAAEQALRANPGYPLAVRYLVAALGQLGLPAEAAGLLPVLRRVDGNLAGLEALTRQRFVPPAAEHLMDGFRKGGFS